MRSVGEAGIKTRIAELFTCTDKAGGVLERAPILVRTKRHACLAFESSQHRGALQSGDAACFNFAQSQHRVYIDSLLDSEDCRIARLLGISKTVNEVPSALNCPTINLILQYPLGRIGKRASAKAAALIWLKVDDIDRAAVKINNMCPIGIDQNGVTPDNAAGRLNRNGSFATKDDARCQIGVNMGARCTQAHAACRSDLLKYFGGWIHLKKNTGTCTFVQSD